MTPDAGQDWIPFAESQPAEGSLAWVIDGRGLEHICRDGRWQHGKLVDDEGQPVPFVSNATHWMPIIAPLPDDLRWIPTFQGQDPEPYQMVWGLRSVGQFTPVAYAIYGAWSRGRIWIGADKRKGFSHWMPFHEPTWTGDPIS